MVVGEARLVAVSPLMLTCLNSAIFRSRVERCLVAGGVGGGIGSLRGSTMGCMGTGTRTAVVRGVRSRLARSRLEVCGEKEGRGSRASPGGTSVVSCGRTAKFRTLVKCLCLSGGCRELRCVVSRKVGVVRTGVWLEGMLLCGTVLFLVSFLVVKFWYVVFVGWIGKKAEGRNGGVVSCAETERDCVGNYRVVLFDD